MTNTTTKPPTHRTDRERKKGTADLLVLTLLAEQDRHGYELAKVIEQRSDGLLIFHVASLYTLLYRLEGRGLIRGRWVEKPGTRRRRFYSLTSEGRVSVERQRRDWRQFVLAVDRILEPEPA
ncbi:MAG: PadR family transcriptional regulator [Deltaproteobacteria bacterium]|nr:PadR family transcriptional regulator [Deltaproteobacteria bacterium]